ncbi:hypothetical protein [Buchananella hordeovulneris]|uniref:DUF4232 domain-containing protein n=1 Tax=Buchananella hordeovulneris TaxID=52770 RepID=A0A1Q5PYM7_9ACTO|nr:hypothetical protein [Buchananella hordeovulneris]MDO5081325.1 hypothetical protein [Buchananella hordeovulneris]OKL52637.1 hypothetical protein BSZ40_00530 [Buchananella hordeovulneris]RRD42711.1 hypothetical protein EII13_08930 [Buchananella hordeovulneris]RRD51931.1 hypothetical protein EII12_06555 [Buchananella hordeovulneris]
MVIAAVLGVGLLLLVFWGTLWLVGKITGSDATQANEPTEIFTPSACAQDSLLLTSTAPSTATAGEPLNIEVSVSTTSEQPCLLDVGEKMLGITVHTGEQLVLDTRGCAAAEAEQLPLLLRQGDTWKQTFTWDGLVRGEGCEAGSKAAAGTYVVRYLHGEHKVTEPTIITLQ